ncbi:MAG: hypothetical protein RIB03_08330 [Henriciella sp.]|uniref:hypothetical protein n=1 Tax=Henriciella sp. TaxID=1968823 RepID=UPI0032ECAFAE
MLNKFFAVAGISVLLVASANAQEGDLNSAAERTAACMAIEDASARLACFEDAAQGLNEALKSDKTAAPEASAAPAATPAADPRKPEQPEIVAEPSQPDWAEAPEPEPEAPKQATASTATEDADESTPFWARVFNDDGDKDKADQISVSVVRILRNNVGRHFFITSDGQEWEQTVAEKVSPPRSLPAAATIKSSLIGSPKLTFDDGPSGAYPVRRTK